MSKTETYHPKHVKTTHDTTRPDTRRRSKGVEERNPSTEMYKTETRTWEQEEEKKNRTYKT